MSRLYHFFFALVFLFSLPAYSNNYANLTLKKALEIAPSLAKANHWYAVIIGKKGVLEGTKQKIINSYEVEKYCLRAIELDPYYDGSHHVMGRWHYNVADLSWIERNIASLVYATPPEGTFGEAAEYFKSAISAKTL